MRKLLGMLVAMMATVALMVALADLSSAGRAPTMQATPATSEEPADVTVTNTDDAASTCEDPYSAGGQTVTLNLADDNGPVQTDTVTPDGMAITHVDTATGGATADTVSIAKADISGLANDDIVIVALSQYDDSDDYFSNDDGFTIVDYATTAGADLVTAIAYKVMTDVAGEPTTWDFYNTYSTEKAAAASAFRGIDTADPFDVAVPTTPDNGTNDGNPPGMDITTGVDDAMIIVSEHMANQNTSPTKSGGAPSGFALGAWYQHIGNDFTVAGMAHLIKASSGTETIGDWTDAPGETVSEWHSYSFSLNPEAGMGNWAHTYTGLPAGNYQVTGSCNAPTNGMIQAGPQAVPDPTFTYQPVNFVVTAPPEPEPEDDTADAGVTVGPVRASPAFTG